MQNVVIVIDFYRTDAYKDGESCKGAFSLSFRILYKNFAFEFQILKYQPSFPYQRGIMNKL